MASTTAGLAATARSLRFWDTTIGKKAIMASTGAVLAGFVVAHLAGNLQIFLGPDRFNAYAHALKAIPELLWVARSVLLVSVLLHIWSAVQLMVLKNEARPIGYVKHKMQAGSYAARTMYMSGPIVAAFIVYHLLEFTIGAGGTPFTEGDAYGNVINGFRVPAVALFYIVAIGLLSLHLRHGIASAVQSLGFYHPRHTPRVKLIAALIAAVIFFGFVSIPVAVLTGVIPSIL
jgi:succinate dehydrogenase / fumarate reductase cytochrome b subunit